MSDIVLKDRDGNPVTYPGINAIQVVTADGEETLFTSGEAGGGTGSGVLDENKPIRFYDPYGDVLYAYTKEEIQELEELPAGPVLRGVTFETWTHTLDELKQITYYADVGPTYKYGSYPADVLIIETIAASTAVALKLDISSITGTIYWGDGSSTSIAKSTSHTYAQAGEYIIAIASNSTGVIRLGLVESSYSYNVVGGNSININTTSSSYVNGTTSYFLKSIIGSTRSFYNMYYTNVNSAVLNSTLKFVSLYGDDALGYNSKCFMHCSALQVVASKRKLGNFGYAFCMDASLRRIYVNNAPNSALMGCSSLKEVMYGAGAISISKMNVQWAMLMTSTTPPTISATNPVWGTKPIYVPDAAVDTYKAAAGWSTAADYIVPASQYHNN